jgi:hypothetical protein
VSNVHPSEEQRLPQVSPEVAAYNEAWRVMTAINKSMFEPATVGADPKYLENRLRLAFETGWNSCAHWFESRTIKELSGG